MPSFAIVASIEAVVLMQMADFLGCDAEVEMLKTLGRNLIHRNLGGRHGRELTSNNFEGAAVPDGTCCKGPFALYSASRWTELEIELHGLRVCHTIRADCTIRFDYYNCF
jgi:hypothetical protein